MQQVVSVKYEWFEESSSPKQSKQLKRLVTPIPKKKEWNQVPKPPPPPLILTTCRSLKKNASPASFLEALCYD